MVQQLLVVLMLIVDVLLLQVSLIDTDMIIYNCLRTPHNNNSSLLLAITIKY